VVGAEQPRVDVRAVRRELRGHVLVDELDVLELVEAAGDAGLVRDHRHRYPAALSRAIAAMAPSMKRTSSRAPT
jgi:hypothetical protein